MGDLMLRPLALVDLALGLILLVSDPRRLTAPSFDTAKEVAPLTVWGAVLAVVGVFLLLNFAPRLTLLVGTAWYAFFGIAFVISGLTALGSWTPIPLYAFMVYAHLTAAGV